MSDIIYCCPHCRSVDIVKFPTQFCGNKTHKYITAWFCRDCEKAFTKRSGRSKMMFGGNPHQFTIASRATLPAMNNLLTMSHVVISICEPHKEFVELPENEKRVGLLQLKYTDDDRPTQHNTGKLFTPEHAVQVLELVLPRIKELDLVVCQCDGGVSRSSGTAAALSKIVNNDDNWVFNNRRYVPNMLVYRTLLNTWQDKFMEG